MPRLNKTRIINLNYNDGKRTIYNEIFDYGDGKDTLFSMDNGIGKTVLIQFFIQPFVRNKRELQGRKFEDYFSNTPTYILHEILLDNGEKLLVGMLIKRDTSEDEKNKLKICAFLNKYSKPNDFDIINVPFVEGRKILSFSECEDRIKKYKSGKLNFKYYNFNDGSKKREYFEDLKSYRIDYKEWEDIIRVINNDESGLSNLYDKHKTDEALIRNVIIPLIESKINGEKDAIEAVRSNLRDYIESFKQSKESLYEVKLLKDFQGDMAPVIRQLREGIDKENLREALYKRLTCLALLCEKELSSRYSEKLRFEELISDLQNELTLVAYEEHSLNYYNFEAEEEKAAQSLEEIRKTYDEKEMEREGALKEKYIQECAEIYEELLSIDSNLKETRERIANYEREDSEIASIILNYRYTLKHLYDLELKELKDKEKDILHRDSKAKEDFEKIKQELNVNDLKQKDTITAMEGCKNKIHNFEKVEEKFRNKYKDFKAIRNVLLNEYDEKELEEYSLSIQDIISSNVTSQKKLKDEVAYLKGERDSLNQSIENTNSTVNEKQGEIISKENELKLFNTETDKILKILTVKNLPADPVSQRDALRKLIESEKNKLHYNVLIKQEKLRKVEDEIYKYETGLIQLPEEVLKSFENKGIQFEYALSWLQKYKGSKEEKEDLIQNNPFFPYGILLSDKDINLLKNESLDVFTAVPIPIINKSHLARGIEFGKNNDVLTIQNQEFLIAFNYLLIDEEERAELLKALSLEVEILNKEITGIHNLTERNKGYERTLDDYPYRGDEGKAIKSCIISIEQEIKELEVLLEQFKNDLQNNEQKKEDINNELSELGKMEIILVEKSEKFTEFLYEHQEFKKNNKELDILRMCMKALQVEERNLEEDGNRFSTLLSDLKIEKYKIKESIRECSNKFELYRAVTTGILLDKDKASIEAKLHACEKELDGNIKRDKIDEERLSKDLRKAWNKLDRKAKDGNVFEQYVGVTFSESRLEELKIQIKDVEEEIKGLVKQINELDKKNAIIATEKRRELKDISELGFTLPIAKDKIKNPDFKSRKEKIKKDLQQNDDIIQEYQKQIKNLESITVKLESYKSYATNQEAVDFSFKDLAVALNIIEQDIETYKAIRAEINTMENRLTKEVRTIYEKYRDKNRFIQERLNSYLNKERKIANFSHIESFLEVVGRKVSTLEIELSQIKMEEEMVINNILRYATHVLGELRIIDKKSSIKHLGKTQKLLEISIPEEKDAEALKEFIKEKVSYYATMEGDYLNLLESDINSAELLSKLIGNLNRVRVDIKKIEKTRLVRKSWKEALSQNSGGEKFVSMFILLSCLMSYMRRRETDIDYKEEKKILIMDNPFAKTNAEHLLEPMFQIAEKYNIQLICFSGIGGSSVYNRFDKIYVAKVIEDRFRNKENVSFKAGNEETLELSDFTITKEQLSIF